MPFPEIDASMLPLVSDIADIPDDLDINYEEECFFLRVPIAASECGRWLVTIDVGWREYEAQSPCPGVKPLDFVMFGYEITAFDQVDSVLYQTMDPREARCGIPEEVRPLVVEIACECYERLICECDPEYIYRVTWIEEPGENALNKHTKATETLTQAGYSVVMDGTDKHGCKFWLLGKSDADHSNLEQPELDDQLGAEP